jgi:ribosomal-protein-alanine N-acetyltransferase
VLRKVRPASPADAGSLAAIDVNVNINPWNARQFAAACSEANAKEQFAMVVEESGRTVGFVVFSQVLDEASIFSIGVHFAHQRKGLGYLLLESALLKMKNDGATRCLLEVRQSNAVARRLYEGNGFKLDGIRKSYYPTQGGREDALLMSRCL